MAAVKAAACEAIVAAGGTITHHHAVGRDHAPYMAAEIGELGLDVLRAVKERLDPAGIMNPGKLLRPAAVPAGLDLTAPTRGPVISPRMTLVPVKAGSVFCSRALPQRGPVVGIRGQGHLYLLEGLVGDQRHRLVWHLAAGSRRGPSGQRRSPLRGGRACSDLYSQT